MTVHSPQTTAHGEVIEIRSQVAPAQDGAVEAVPAYFTPDTLIDDLMDELAEAREMVVYLTRANEALAGQVERLERELSISRMAQVVMDNGVAEVERLTAERDKAYANGYSDAETEISQSVLGLENTFLHSQYADAKLRIEDLQAQTMRLSGMVHDLKKEVAISDALLISEAEASLERLARAVTAEAERDRLRACVDAVMLDRKRIMEDRDLIMQCRICPSCQDSLDLPGGDGCANMPAHDPLGRVIPVNLEDL